MGYFFERILYMPVPHFAHFPLTASLPFFMVTVCAFTMSLVVRHFTQYPFSAIFLSSSICDQ